MREEALLLTSGGPALEVAKTAKLLRFFGIAERALAVEEFPACTGAGQGRSAKYRLFCSSDTFSRLIAGLEESLERLRAWREHVHSAFVYAGEDYRSLEKLARTLTGDEGAALTELAGRPGCFAVSEGLTDVCGAMTGVRLAASRANVGARVTLHTSKEYAAKIISFDRSWSFLRARYQKVDVFFSTSNTIIDIDTELLNGGFDIREYVMPGVPIVLYIKWAFAQTCSKTLETNACLVVDDPVLKPTYGFLNFRELLGLMKRHNFSSNVAFIPWNWRRTDPEVARLFKENPREYSISIHGCDHTREEFGNADREQLYRKATQALERMNCHESSTGIAHDRVMVFPQGVFSEAAMRALKHTEFIGAVNNDTISADPHPRAIRIADVWDVAVMGYSNFPLFTRRYPWEGVENFAFDSLLGKPVIIVIHHDFFRDGCTRLVEFIESLNALRWRLAWRSLAEVVRRSFRQRQLQGGVAEIDMYGAELRLGNGSNDTRRFCIKKRESDPFAIKGIWAGPRQIPWKFADGHLTFDLELRSGESVIMRVEYQRLSEQGRTAETMSYTVQTMLRRYLSEARDNYLWKFRSIVHRDVPR